MGDYNRVKMDVVYHYRGYTLRLAQGDLTKYKVDCVVSPANGHMVQTGGLAGRLASADGPNMQRETDRLRMAQYPHTGGVVEVGKCLITKTNNLKTFCKYIVHAVGPNCNRYQENQDRFSLTYSATAEALKLAEATGDCYSIAIPAIGRSNFRMKPTESTGVIVTAIKDFLDEGQKRIREVHLVERNNRTLQQFRVAVQEMILPDDIPMEGQASAKKPSSLDTVVPRPSTATTEPAQTPSGVKKEFPKSAKQKTKKPTNKAAASKKPKHEAEQGEYQLLDHKSTARLAAPQVKPRKLRPWPSRPTPRTPLELSALHKDSKTALLPPPIQRLTTKHKPRPGKGDVSKSGKNEVFKSEKGDVSKSGKGGPSHEGKSVRLSPYGSPIPECSDIPKPQAKTTTCGLSLVKPPTPVSGVMPPSGLAGLSQEEMEILMKEGALPFMALELTPSVTSQTSHLSTPESSLPPSTAMVDDFRSANTSSLSRSRPESQGESLRLLEQQLQTPRSSRQSQSPKPLLPPPKQISWIPLRYRSSSHSTVPECPPASPVIPLKAEMTPPKEIQLIPRRSKETSIQVPYLYRIPETFYYSPAQPTPKMIAKYQKLPPIISASDESLTSRPRRRSQCPSSYPASIMSRSLSPQGKRHSSADRERPCSREEKRQRSRRKVRQNQSILKRQHQNMMEEQRLQQQHNEEYERNKRVAKMKESERKLYEAKTRPRGNKQKDRDQWEKDTRPRAIYPLWHLGEKRKSRSQWYPGDNNCNNYYYNHLVRMEQASKNNSNKLHRNDANKNYGNNDSAGYSLPQTKDPRTSVDAEYLNFSSNRMIQQSQYGAPSQDLTNAPRRIPSSQRASRDFGYASQLPANEHQSNRHAAGQPTSPRRSVEQFNVQDRFNQPSSLSSRSVTQTSYGHMDSHILDARPKDAQRRTTVASVSNSPQTYDFPTSILRSHSHAYDSMPTPKSTAQTLGILSSSHPYDRPHHTGLGVRFADSEEVENQTGALALEPPEISIQRRATSNPSAFMTDMKQGYYPQVAAMLEPQDAAGLSLLPPAHHEKNVQLLVQRPDAHTHHHDLSRRNTPYNPSRQVEYGYPSVERASTLTTVGTFPSGAAY